MEVIKRWIDESDIYSLLLGGQYGSVVPDSGKSYTELEYEYAIEIGVQEGRMNALSSQAGALKEIKKIGAYLQLGDHVARTLLIRLKCTVIERR